MNLFGRCATRRSRDTGAIQYGVDVLYQFYPAAEKCGVEELERLLRHQRLRLRRLSELALPQPDEFLLRPATEEARARGAGHLLQRRFSLSWSHRLAFAWFCKVRSDDVDVFWVRQVLNRYLELKYFFARFFATCADRKLWEAFGGGLDGVCVEFRVDATSFLAESVRIDYLPRSAMRPIDLYRNDERQIVVDFLTQRSGEAEFMQEYLWFIHCARNYIGAGAYRDKGEIHFSPDTITGVIIGQRLEEGAKQRMLKLLRECLPGVAVFEARLEDLIVRMHRIV